MKAAVIGGGPAGCAAAYALRKRGHEVRLIEAQDHVGGRTSQLIKDGFNMSSGALFLMGEGLYPRTYALMREMGHASDLVTWGGKTQVIDWNKKRYECGFDKIITFLNMPVFSAVEKITIAKNIAKVFLKPGPKSVFDSSELAKFDPPINLEDWTKDLMGEKGLNYIMTPYMGFLYAVPPSWLSISLMWAVMLQFYKMELHVPPGGIGVISEYLVQNTPG